MKHLLTLFIIPLFVFTSNPKKEDFLGKWNGDDKSEIGYITFDNEGYATFEIQGQIIGGKEFTMNGKKGKMSYSINFNTTPIEVDFIVTKLASKESKKILGIAEFLDNDTMRFAMDFNAKRPTEFGDHTILLERVK